MIKNNPKLKLHLSFEDQLNAINYLVSGYFVNNQYTPYYRNIYKLLAVFNYCVDGVEFEYIKDEDGNDTDQLESMYPAITGDTELMELYSQINQPRTQFSPDIVTDWNAVLETVDEIVEYEKERRIHNNDAVNNKLLELINAQIRQQEAETKAIESLDQLIAAQARQVEESERLMADMTDEEKLTLTRKLAENKVDYQEIADLVTKSYLKNSQDDKLNEIVQAKNEKIRELEVYKKLQDAKNVLADK